jgi:hypothetical protein
LLQVQVLLDPPLPSLKSTKTRFFEYTRRNEKNERLKPLGNFATMRVCKGLSKMSFKKAVKVAQSVKV